MTDLRNGFVHMDDSTPTPAATEMSEAERYIRRQGELYGVPPDEFVKLSEVMRATTRSKWMREQRKLAGSQNLDVEEFVNRATESLDRTLAAEFPTFTRPAASTPSFQTASGPVPSPGYQGLQILPGGMPRRVPFSGVPDMVGDRTPRTLADIYARWPVGREPGYHLRVERTQPRFFQNVPCAGYVGDVSVELSERDFGVYFGGREYLIEVYGPDPRKQGPSGEPIIKKLSDPIKLSVPVLPPNMMAQSVDTAPKGNDTMYPQPHYGMPMQAQQPQTSPQEVRMVEVLGNMLQKQVERQERQAERTTERTPDGVLTFVRDTSNSAAQIAQEALKAEREARMKAEERANAKTDPTVELMKALAPNKDEIVRHLETNYQAQLRQQGETHAALLATMKDRHDGELRRADEAFRALSERSNKDVEQVRAQASRDLEAMRDSHRIENEAARRDFESRERNLRDELRDVRSELRADADKRIQELKDVHGKELDNLEKSFQRELRSEKGSSDTKLHVTDLTRQGEIAMLREKLGEREQEIMRLRAENERLGDPVEQIKSMEEKAIALGYQKADPSAPTGAWEHLAQSVGAGLGQLMGSAGEWGPSLYERMQQGQVMRQQQALQMQAMQLQAAQLPPGAQAGQQAPGQAPGQAPPAPQASRAKQRAVRWATEHTALPTPVPNGPSLGFQAEPGPQPLQEIPTHAQPLAAPVQVTAPAEEAPAPAATQAAEEDPAGGIQLPSEADLDQMMPPLTPGLAKVFGKQAVFGFLMTAEEQVRTGMPADTFLEAFAKQFPAEARAAYGVGLQEFSTYIESIPGMDETSIRSRRGQKWLEQLFDAMSKKFGG